jgi:hypothetical protein
MIYILKQAMKTKSMLLAECEAELVDYIAIRDAE